MGLKTRLQAGFTIFGLFALLLPAPVLAQIPSQPRILRLSFVQGQVALARPDVQGWSEAPVNTPLEQGFQLSTGQNSFAEIQFENGSTIRLGEQSTIALTELAQTADGNRVDRVELRQGYATFHPVSPGAQESLQVSTPEGRVSASSDAQFRVDLDQSMERVEVFSGMLDADSNLGSVALQADSVLILEPGAADPAQVSQGITEDDWDRWVADREVGVSPTGPSPDSYEDETAEVPYGWDDLSENGSWVDVESLGPAWSPNVSVGWSPYSSGRWCWYPGVGYTWIASEPWGWLPYHYGEWELVPGHGWVWLPERIKNWSPARVDWYQGPGWVAWRPTGRDRTGREDCGSSCGGGSLTTGVFSQGGSISPSNMLGVSLSVGSRVQMPRIAPTTTSMLPGSPQPFSPAQGRGTWSISRSQIGPWAPAPSTNPEGSMHRTKVGITNPAIVYDPSAGSYVNSQRPSRPARPPIYPSGSMRPATLTPLAPNSSVSPSPAARSTWESPSESQPQANTPSGGQAPLQPVQGVFAAPATPRPAGSDPHPNTGAGQGGPGQPGAGSGHTGGWAPAGGQNAAGHGSGWTPAGGSSSSSSAASAPNGHH